MSVTTFTVVFTEIPEVSLLESLFSVENGEMVTERFQAYRYIIIAVTKLGAAYNS